VIDVALIAAASAFSSSGENSAIVAGNHAPGWLGLPRGGGDCGPENSGCGGTLCRRQQLLLVVWQILGESSAIPFGVTVRKPSASAPDFSA